MVLSQAIIDWDQCGRRYLDLLLQCPGVGGRCHGLAQLHAEGVHALRSIDAMREPHTFHLSLLETSTELFRARRGVQRYRGFHSEAPHREIAFRNGSQGLLREVIAAGANIRR